MLLGRVDGDRPQHLARTSAASLSIVGRLDIGRLDIGPLAVGPLTTGWFTDPDQFGTQQSKAT